jgi:hypothetical protein
MDVDLPKGKMEEELLVASGLLKNGIEIIRLNSRKYQVLLVVSYFTLISDVVFVVFTGLWDFQRL